MRTNASLQRVALDFFSVVIFLVLLPISESFIADTASAALHAAHEVSDAAMANRHEVLIDANSPNTNLFKGSVTAQIPNPFCPPPSKRNAAGTECVFTGDVTLSRTLNVGPHQTLNCQSHKLLPSKRGTSVVIRSEPEVAIFLNQAENVQIKNCFIEGFDFGIFAINSKRGAVSAPNKIFQNRINARFVAISFMSVDDSEIRNNQLSWTTKGGRGLYVGRDSDGNRILNNQLSAKLSNKATEAVRVPGPVKPLSNSIVTEGSAVFIAQIEGPEPSLLDAVIEGNLFQLTVTDAQAPNADFSVGNTFTGNAITLVGGVPVDGILLSLPQGTVVSRNRITGARNGVRVGIQTGPAPGGSQKQFPGKCTGAQSRFCFVDGDCNFPGSTVSPPFSGTCTNPSPATKPVFWTSLKNTISGNVISASIDAGISSAGEDTLISSNTITGKSGTDIGVRLIGPFALASTVVTRNTIESAGIALSLVEEVQRLPAQSFTAKISRNDFVGYITAVLISGKIPPSRDRDYDRVSRLSVNGIGNHWGFLCDVGFDPNLVKHSDDTVQPLGPPALVEDSHPFGQRVAKANSLLRPCR
jgi:hypothetical protein